MGNPKFNINRIRSQERGLIYIRDALSFYLTEVRKKYDTYNIIIIFLSMITAFFETVKTELEWDTRNGNLKNISSLVPIAMNSCIALISTYSKFLRFTEKIEDTTKSIEKCHTAIDKQRKVLLHTSPIMLGDGNEDCQDTSSEKGEYTEDNEKYTLIYTDACTSFREAILEAEKIWLSRMDPIVKSKYLQRSYRIHQIFDSKFKSTEKIDTILRQSFKPEHLPSYFRFRLGNNDNLSNFDSESDTESNKPTKDRSKNPKNTTSSENTANSDKEYKEDTEYASDNV